MIIRKIVYTCFSLLFFAPTTLFSAEQNEQQKYVLLVLENNRIGTESPRHAFVPANMSIKDLKESLDYSPSELYIGDEYKDISNSEENSSLASLLNQKTAKEALVTEKNFEGALENWLLKKANLFFEETTPKNVLIIKSKDPSGYEEKKMNTLWISSSDKKVLRIVLLNEKGFSNVTIGETKERIKAKRNIEIENQSLMYATKKEGLKKLDDNSHTLGRYNLNENKLFLEDKSPKKPKFDINDYIYNVNDTDDSQSEEEKQDTKNTLDLAKSLIKNPKSLIIIPILLLVGYLVVRFATKKKAPKHHINKRKKMV